jgi:hypothetical protein
MAQATFAANAKIKLVVEANPKRKGTDAAKRFRLYSKVATVEQFLEKGGTRADLAWDTARGFVKVLAARKAKAN